MAPLRPFLELDQVSLQYGGTDGTLALEDLSMEVQPGAFVAVVGPSGCGKSTLMKLLSGLWPASDGTVIVDGHEVAGPLSIAGMAFQNPTLLPWRSVLRNVLSLRANDDETSSPRKFSLEGAEGSSCSCP